MLVSVGFVAAILTTVSFLPQAVKVIKTKDTSSLSLGMYAMFTLGVTLWMFYGFGRGDLAIIGSNLITLVFALVILSFKIMNIRNGKDAVS